MKLASLPRNKGVSRRNFRVKKLAAACALMMAGSGANAQAAADAATTTIVVTGIRASLGSSMNLKRDSHGVVDGILAEDIGKFPDTNLAESLQRISGVSIDRSVGEGSKVTVRGVGPEFNLVLLNGRQMPTSNIQAGGASNSRAFDFANLASESVSQVQVYKTSRASTPTGGIGATINIMTARPLDNKNKGFHASVGLKMVRDTSIDDLPSALQGKSNTPELSGIFSNTFGDGKFGIAVSGSIQERDLGFNQAAVPGGWRGPFTGAENNWGTIPNTGAPGSERVTNHPGPTDIYSVPQNINYSVNGISRQRTNGQLTLQFAPTSKLKTTLDYTYSENKLQTKRSELSAWMNFGPSTTSWTNGPIAGPVIYSEIIGTGAPGIPPLADVAMAAQQHAAKNENTSLGFNAEWKVTDRLTLEFDAHQSTAESSPDSPYGSTATLGTAQFNRGTTTIDFSRDFPVLSIAGAGNNASLMQVTGSSFQNSYTKSDIDQFQFKGQMKVMEYSRLDFGVAATKVNNRTAWSNVQQDSWGGATSPADYPDTLWKPATMNFGKIDGGNSPGLYNQFFTFDFEAVRKIAATVGNPANYLPTGVYSQDRTTEEKSKSAYLQFNTDWDTAMPIGTAIGLRFEKTDVVSTARVPVVTGIRWVSANELNTFGPGTSTNTTLTGSYNHILPSIDFDIEPTSKTKVRASYGESIGRPGWGDIQGGQTLNGLVRVNGGTGAQGSPGLKPVKSKNFDLSFEYYYDKGSYASVGYFQKSVSNYVGVSQITATPFNLRTPVGGVFWNEAVANGCTTVDVVCIRNYILNNKDGQAGVVKTGVNPQGDAIGTITGQPTDPIASFLITVPANQKSDKIDGWELNLQHMFGTTGFGVAANYTKVNSGLKYDNAKPGEQFALEGLSDSANLVGFYENAKWEVRVAYNWRDEFLSGRFDGAGPNPVYTEAYGQLDLNVGYKWNDKLSFQFEAINLTDEIQRLHSRQQNQVEFVTQAGPRYMIGARYKF